MLMNETILTNIEKQAFLETLDADPEWAFEVLNRLLKRKERAETFREWLGINELARAIKDLAEAQQRTEEQVQRFIPRLDAIEEEQSELKGQIWLSARIQTETNKLVQSLVEAQRKTEEQLQSLTNRVDALAEAQQKTEAQIQALTKRVDTLDSKVDALDSKVDTLTSRVDALDSKVDALDSKVDALDSKVDALDSKVDTLTSRVDALAEAQQKTEQQVGVLTHNVSGLSDVLGPTWEVEARESVAFLLPKSGVRLLTPLEAQEKNEWDGVAEAEWDGRPVQVRMEAKVSAGDGRIISFANRVRSLVRKTGIEVIPVFCGIRLYSGAREEALKQKIVLVGLREIRNEIPLTIFTISPQDL